MRQRITRPTGCRDTDRIIAGRNPVAAQFGGLAQIIAIVGGKAFRAVEKRMNPCRLEQGQPVHRMFKDRLEMVPIFGQRVKTEILADAVHAPWLGLGFKRPDHHFARVGFVIGAFVRHPQHRQMAKARDRLGDQIKVFAGMQRQRHARFARQLTAPHTAAIDHNISRDMARLAFVIDKINAGHAAICLCDIDHFGMFKDFCAPHPRALGQCHRDVGRVALPVQRQMHGADHIPNFQMRIHRLCFKRRDFLHIHIENPRNRRLAQQFLMPRRRQGDGNRPHLPHAGFNAGFCRQFHI